MSTVPTSWMSRSKSVDCPTGTDLMNVLSIAIFMFLVSVGDGVGSGDGGRCWGGGRTRAAATGDDKESDGERREQRSIDSQGLTPGWEWVKGTAGLYRLGGPESSNYGELRRNSSQLFG
jgi:hypothetical protein